MKYVLVVGDGMSDYPIPELGDKTPLQAAVKPNMDAIAAKGRSGLIKNVPDEMHSQAQTQPYAPYSAMTHASTTPAEDHLKHPHAASNLAQTTPLTAAT